MVLRSIETKKNVQKLISKASEKFYGLIGKTVNDREKVGEDEDYNQADAAGFINLFGLSIKERAKLSKNWPEVKE